MTAQSEPIPGKAQTVNSAGGYVFKLNPWDRLLRFLILGAEGGTYYTGERPLIKDNALSAIACIQEDGKRAVDLIVAISESGRAPKNDPAIFILALASAACLADGRPAIGTRQYALAKLPNVCRIPTHLYHFNEYCKGLRGWGPTLKRAEQEWFLSMPVGKLAYELVKYQQRDGWSARDCLRKSHPVSVDEAYQGVFRWASGQPLTAYDVIKKSLDGTRRTYQYPAINAALLPAIIPAFEEAKTAGTEELVHLIHTYDLSREMVPTEALTKPEIWDALLEKMPYTAMLRNLGNMSKVGLLKPLSDAEREISDRLVDVERIRKSRVHPITVLMALKTYAQGHGLKGKGEWTVVPKIVDALDDAFYLSFQGLEPIGKRFLIGIDVSSSMSSPCAGTPLSCAEGAAAMALSIAKVEPRCFIHGFTAGQGRSSYRRLHDQAVAGFVDLGITPKMRLDAVLMRTTAVNFGATDCSVPALWATENKYPIDCIVIITDNETWAGSIHPPQALERYREKMGIPVKQIVIAMTSTDFTIADPGDVLSLDVVGFDASVPQVVQEFCRS